MGYKWNISKEKGKKILEETIISILKENIDNLIDIDELSFLINSRTKNIVIRNNNKIKNMMNYVKNNLGGLINFVENNNKLIIKNEEIKPNTSKIGIRPEHILISNEDNFKLSGKIRHLENLGEHLLTYISLENNEEIIAKVDNVGDRKIGDKINLFWDSSKIHYFNKENKRI